MPNLLKLLLKYRIQIILCAATLLILFVPLLGNLITVSYFILIGTVVGFLIYSWLAKDRFDTKLFAFLALVFFVVYLAYPHTDQATLLFRMAAVMAFVLFHFVLLIGPWARFSKWVRKQYRHRRHLGVTVYLLSLTHACVMFRTYFSFSVHDVFLAIFTFFGFTALYIFTYMALTSWDYLQKHVLKNQWSIIYTVLLLGYAIAIWYYFTLQTASQPPNERQLFTLYLPFAFFAFGLIVAPFSIVNYFFYKVNGWKQLHVLVYVAYVSSMVHVWQAYLYNRQTYLQILFWVGFASIALSHAAGWIIKWKEDRYFRNRVLQLNKSISQNGKAYIAVASTQEFTEGKGEKFIVKNVPIAAFLFKGNYFAISNICGHQKGPMYQGLLTPAGYVVCPWHQYSYSVKDGSGPPGFSDHIPSYPTLVKNGLVYVSVS